jgi:hypothetical protein
MKKGIIISVVVVTLALAAVLVSSAFAGNSGSANNASGRAGGMMGRSFEDGDDEYSDGEYGDFHDRMMDQMDAYYDDYDVADLISSEAALSLAQDYIESNGLEGYTIEEHTFTGSTSEVSRLYVYDVTDGDTFVGMIHVDGITSEVWLSGMHDGSEGYMNDGRMGGGHMGGRGRGNTNDNFDECPMFDDELDTTDL